MMYLRQNSKLEGIEIVGKGSKGDWFGKWRGVIIFIRGKEKLERGQKVNLRVTAVESTCATAEVIE